MNVLIKKYLSITKSASGQIVIEDNSALKESVDGRFLGKYLYETYGIIKIMFAEPGYMQYKFLFNCKTEDFKLVRYPEGTKSFDLTNSASHKKMYDIIMDKALGSSGWIFKNMFLKFDLSKNKELRESVKFKVLDKPKAKEEEKITYEPKESTPKGDDFTYGGNLMIGDSQMVGNIGKELQSKFGGTVVAKSGSVARQWISDAESEDGKLGKELRTNPKNIFMLFGGNGTSGITELLNTIHEITPESKIHFISLPSPASPANGNVTLYEKHFPGKKRKYNYQNLRTSRKGAFTNSEKKVKASNPASVGKADFIDIFSYEWQCEKDCDGIHVTRMAAKEIVSNINIKEESNPQIIASLD